mgnify:FL=1
MLSKIQTTINMGLNTLLMQKPLTPQQVQEVFERLSYLAYNLTASSLSIKELKQLYSHGDEDLPKEILPSALYKNQVLINLFKETPDLSKTDTLSTLLSSEQMKIGQQVLENAELAGLINQTQNLVFFSSRELGDYFCGIYLQSQELNTELLKEVVTKNSRFHGAVKIWAELVPNLIEKLKSRFDSEERRIYYIFAMIGTPDAFKPMLQIIKDKTQTESNRLLVMFLFKQYVKEVSLDVVTTFLEIIKDTKEDKNIRQAAVDAIMKYSDVSYPYLVGAYQSDDIQTRYYSVIIVGQLSTQQGQAIPFFFPALKDNVEKIRIAALSCIINFIVEGQIERTDLEPYFEYLLNLYLKGQRRFKVKVAEILAWYGDKPALLFLCDSILEETDTEYCEEMLGILGQIREPEVILTLQKLLYRPNRKIIAAETAKILKRFQAKEAIPDLLKLLEEGYRNNSDEDREDLAIFLFETAEILISMGSSDILNILLPLYYGEDLDTYGKYYLIQALVKFDHSEAFTICNQLFYDKSESICRAAAQGLAKLKGAEILPFFSDMLKNNNLTIVQKAAIIRALPDSKDQRAEDILLPILENSDRSLWTSAIYSLGKLKSRKALPKLEWLKWNDLSKVREGSELEIRYFAARAIDRIQQDN